MERCYAIIKGRRYEFDLYPPVFEFYWEINTRGWRSLVLAWRRETQFTNIIRLRMIVFHLGPPWFRHTCCIVNLDDPIPDDER